MCWCQGVQNVDHLWVTQGVKYAPHPHRQSQRTGLVERVLFIRLERESSFFSWTCRSFDGIDSSHKSRHGGADGAALPSHITHIWSRSRCAAFRFPGQNYHMKSICLVISVWDCWSPTEGLPPTEPRSGRVHFKSLVWGFQYICTIAGHIFALFITEANKYKSVTAGSLCLRFNL